MLELQQIEKRFDRSGSTPLFSGVSLTLAAGECVAIMGESGVGKSTLLNCIAGLESIDGGRLVLDGEDLSTLTDDEFTRLRRRKFGFVFQAFHILPHLTLAQNVALPLWLLKVDELRAEMQACAMLERVGLGARHAERPANLSGGELQRVAIARALVHGPSLVLADEPTGNLDSERAGNVLELLLESVREAGAMAVLVTHSHVAAACTDRVLRLTRSGLYENVEG